MPEQDKKKNSLLSYIVTAAIIAAGILLYVNKSKLNTDKHYVVYFSNVDGLTIASQVSINGARVGKVQEVELLDSGLKVTIQVNKDIRIPNGTVAELGSAGISGGKEVLLTTTHAKGYLEEGALIRGVDGSNMLSESGKIGQTVRVAQIALKTTDSIIRDISRLVGATNRGEIRFQLNKLNRETDEASRTSGKVRGNGEGFIANIGGIEKSVADMANSSRKWPAALADAETESGKLVKSTANIAKSLKDLTANVKKIKPILAKATDTSNALGKLIQDNQAYHTMNKQADTFHKGIQDVLDHPASHWFAIFGTNK